MTAVFHVVLPILLIGGAMTSSPPFVPGEVLVHFVSGSAGNNAVEKAIQVTPPDLQALASVVEELQAATRIPLKATRVSSGNWVVLNVEPGPLADRAAGDLRVRKNIESVEVVALEPPPQGLIPRPKGLQVRFTSRSPESVIVSKKMSGAEKKRFDPARQRVERGPRPATQGIRPGKGSTVARDRSRGAHPDPRGAAQSPS